MNKVIRKSVLALLLILPLVSLGGVSANPIWETFGLYPWVNFKITPSGLHIANDPLFLSSDISSIIPFDPESGTSHLKGWVTFTCATDRVDQKNAPKGFEYSITVKDIAPGSYTIKAYPTVEVMQDGSVVPSSDLGTVDSYILKTVKVGHSGEFEISGFYDLSGPAIYAWKITVESNGTPIFESHPADPIGFVVIS